MRLAWFAAILTVACGGGSDSPDARLPGPDEPGPPDAADPPLDDADADAGDVVPGPPGALPAIPFTQWGRFFDMGTGVTIWSHAVAPDGRLYLGVLTNGLFAWHGELYPKAEGPINGGIYVLEVLPDGREGWIHRLPDSNRGPLVALGDGQIYAVVPGWSPAEPYYNTQTFVVLDRVGGAEKWRFTPSLVSSSMLHATEDGDRLYVHGTRLQRLANGNAVTEAPYLAELSVSGELMREWSFDYDGPVEGGPFHFPPRNWVTPGVVFPLDGGLVMVGLNGVMAWDADGYQLWHNDTRPLPTAAKMTADGALWLLTGRELVRLSGATGEVELARDLPASLYGGGLALRQPGDEPIVTGRYGTGENILDFDGELRGPVGAGGLDADQGRTYDAMVAWLDRDGELKGLWAHGEWGEQYGELPTATPAGLVLVGQYGSRPARDWDLGLMTLVKPQQPPSYFPYALAVPWAKLDAHVLPRCRATSGADLVRVGLDVTLVFDISREAAAIVPGTGLPLRQLAANGLAPTFQRIFVSDDRLSYLLYPWQYVAAGSVKAPWPTVDRWNALTNGFYTEVALAPTQLGSTIGVALRRVVHGARALTVGHDRGDLRHGILLIIAASASAPSWTAADLTRLASARTGTPAVAAHVIGLGAPSAAIDALAAAAGAPAVYVPVDTDVPAGVAAAVEAIRRDYRCSYRFSDPHLRPDRTGWDGVEVRAYDPALHARVDIPRVAACEPGGAGWAVEQRAWIETIVMCPATCDALLADTLRWPAIKPYDACPR